MPPFKTGKDNRKKGVPIFSVMFEAPVQNSNRDLISFTMLVSGDGGSMTVDLRGFLRSSTSSVASPA